MKTPKYHKKFWYIIRPKSTNISQKISINMINHVKRRIFSVSISCSKVREEIVKVGTFPMKAKYFVTINFHIDPHYFETGEKVLIIFVEVKNLNHPSGLTEFYRLRISRQFFNIKSINKQQIQFLLKKAFQKIFRLAWRLLSVPSESTINSLLNPFRKLHCKLSSEQSSFISWGRWISMELLRIRLIWSLECYWRIPHHILQQWLPSPLSIYHFVGAGQ